MAAATDVTGYMERAVEVLQAVLALLFLVVFGVGVLNLAAVIAGALLDGGLIEIDRVLGLINTSIDVALSLFIVVELYRTILAYVEARNVVAAVVHAGLIAVVRQIIIFKPADYGDAAPIIGGTYGLLLLVLLAGLVVVHRETDVTAEDLE